MLTKLDLAERQADFISKITTDLTAALKTTELQHDAVTMLRGQFTAAIHGDSLQRNHVHVFEFPCCCCWSIARSRQHFTLFGSLGRSLAHFCFRHWQWPGSCRVVELYNLPDTEMNV